MRRGGDTGEGRRRRRRGELCSVASNRKRVNDAARELLVAKTRHVHSRFGDFAEPLLAIGEQRLTQLWCNSFRACTIPCKKLLDPVVET